jgi:copper oxidase (laccase) domain-containing protein
MEGQYGSRPSELLAGIGPSIGAHHYPVGAEVVEQVKFAFEGDAKHVLGIGNGSESESVVCLDLWHANRLILEKVGVQQIEVSGICTACHLDDWYSHRAEKGLTGRFGALIAAQ